MKTRRNVFIGYLAIIASIFTVSSLGRIVTDSGMDWYSTIALPLIAPPGWFIGFTWSFVFLTVGIASILLYGQAKNPERTKLMIALGLNGVLNILWTVIFFSLHEYAWAFVEIIALELSIVWIMWHAWRVSRSAALFLLPYAVWVPFAGYLTYTIWQLNT